MSASIKVREEDKKEFESLQSELTLRFGKKITQQELFSRIIELVEDSNSKKKSTNWVQLTIVRGKNRENQRTTKRLGNCNEGREY